MLKEYGSPSGGRETAYADGEGTSPVAETGLTAWLQKAVIYQIFVDRFDRRGRFGNPDTLAVWGSKPNRNDQMGGDLDGIIHRLDYLQDLGVNLLCLTPIFLAATNHRYDTYDYYQLDPRIGDLPTFRKLLREAHRRDIRIVLDGVFNHCGRGFFPFFDVMENGAHSSYRDWFYPDGFPLRAYGKHRYAAWQNCAALPEFNLSNPEARGYLLEVARYWTRQGVDGWRLDAVRHARDKTFWKDLKDAIRGENPEAYLLAEIWEESDEWISGGDFDGATNYPLREILFDFIVHRTTSISEFLRRLQRRLTAQPWPVTLAMSNLLGSHDTPRLWTATGGNPAVIKLLHLLQFTLPGIPALYYGDECGLRGGRDPDNRRAMCWNQQGAQAQLVPTIKILIEARRSHPALQCGTWHPLLVNDANRIMGYSRSADAGDVLVMINAGTDTGSATIELQKASIPQPCRFKDLLSGQTFESVADALVVESIQPMSGLLLVPVLE